MKTPRLSLIAALVLLTATSAAAEPESFEARIDEFAGEYMASGKIVGMAVGVVAGPELETVIAGYGRIGKEGEEAPGPDTVYEIGSVTKVFTAVLLAQIAAERKLRLDQPIREVLPADIAFPETKGREIAFLDIATHTSGLPRMPTNFSPKDPRNPYADYSVGRLSAFLGSHRLRRAPGGKYEYSNLAMGLLGLVLARLEEKSYEALVRERITTPLGMKSTGVVLTDEMRKRLAPPYDGLGKPASNWDLAPSFVGAGGLRSTVRDMTRFVRANLVTGKGALHTALAQARRVHWRPTGKGQPHMGLGWHFRPGGRICNHSGQTGGYHSFVGLDIEKRNGVVILTNIGHGAIDSLGGAILNMLSGERREVAVVGEVLDAYVGVYRLEIQPAFELTVTNEGGKLWVQGTGQPKIRVYAESETDFFYRVVDAQIRFLKGEDGKVGALVLTQNGREMRAVRER